MEECLRDPSNPALEVACRAAEAAQIAATAAQDLARQGASIGDWANFIQSTSVPLLSIAAVVLVWKLYKPVLDVIQRRHFLIKLGPFELSAQETADQLVRQVEELQKAVALLGPSLSPGRVAKARSLRILWVDDKPKGNAFGIAGLESLGHRVVTATSNAAAKALMNEGTFDILISDIGRPEGPDAGLALLSELRERGIRTPMAVFSTKESILRNEDLILSLDVLIKTNSFTELLSAVTRFAAGSG